MIKIFTNNKSERIKYTIDFIFTTIGIDHEFVDLPQKSDLCYGTLIKNKLNIVFNENDIIWNKIITNQIEIEKKNISFDIINAIFLFISDKVNNETNKKQLDQHDRLKFVESYQFKEKIHEFPIVNKYIAFIKNWLIYHLEIKAKPFYPNGKKAVIILSHDVDNPGKYDSIFNYKLFPKKLTLKNLIKHYRFYFGTLKQYLFDKQKNENWNFEKIVEKESEKGFSSTYFFATINWQSIKGNKFDVPYNITKLKYRNIISYLNKRKQSIGLHASYDAYKNINNFNNEKEILEKLTGFKIKGLRHHYWHLGLEPEKTLLKHEKLEFTYDSSIAFNDSLGFRFNSAFPFYPFSFKENRKINVLQLPVFCMDGSLFRDPKMEIEPALKKIKQYINTIKKNEGVACIDWHINTSFPGGNTFKKWGKAYLELLDILENDKELWVTNCDDFIEWWLQNRQNEK